MSENGLQKPSEMAKSRLEALEEKIRAKVWALHDTPEGEFVPEHSRVQAIISLMYRYVTENAKYKRYGTEENSVYEFGYEIFDTCVTVLRNYSPDNGDFIHYFNKVIAGTLKRCKGKHDFDERHQAKTVSDNKARTIRALYHKVEFESGEVTAERILQMAKEEGKRVTILEVRDYMQRDERMDRTIDGETESTTFGEMLADQSMGPEDALLSAAEPDEMIRIVMTVDRIYLSVQERQQGYMRESLTARLSEGLAQALREDPDFRDALDKVSWFDRETFRYYVENGEPMMQKDIAARNGVTKEGLSSAMGRVLNRIAEELEKG